MCTEIPVQQCQPHPVRQGIGLSRLQVAKIQPPPVIDGIAATDRAHINGNRGRLPVLFHPAVRNIGAPDLRGKDGVRAAALQGQLQLESKNLVLQSLQREIHPLPLLLEDQLGVAIPGFRRCRQDPQ